MILRCQCRRILSRSPTPAQIQYNHSIPPLSSYRLLHSTSVNRATVIDDADAGIEDTEDLDQDELPQSTPNLRTITRQWAPRESSDDVVEKMTKEQIDMSMSIEDLGLRSVTRTQKREFIRWLKQDGAKFEHFPQHIVMDIEDRRVEQMRKNAEDRMFGRMNKFYNSLTLEEIKEGRLIEEGTVRTKNMNPEKLDALRSQQPLPTPFQRLMTGEEDIDLTRKQIESRVLMLLKQHDEKLHTMYKNYIDWSDYQLQKRTLWFAFPDIPQYADVVHRIRGPDTRRTKPQKPGSEDLADYYGPRLPENTTFPVIPVERNHYLNFRGDNPFNLNRAFIPWRPIPHATRRKMFDAWREGLGLRNVAWLGGVSWRRADGIIGILKKEWEFVQKVLSPASFIRMMNHYYSISLEDYPMVNLLLAFLINPFCFLSYSWDTTLILGWKTRGKYGRVYGNSPRANTITQSDLQGSTLQPP